ncbi:MAG TPA: hypothetical protein VLF20_03180 [Patescibacteria group bacterium]|nr:hypothetical protein [Patescibacteria group bacterium]
MRQRKRSIVLLIISILSFLALAYLIFFISPDYQLLVPRSFSVVGSSLIFFFPLLFLFCFSLITYLFKSKTHGLLVGLFVITFLLFRLSNLTHPFFFILLAGLFLTLELFFAHRK